MLNNRTIIDRRENIFNRIRNWLNGRRIQRYAKLFNIHEGTTQILKYGVWEDSEHNVYNCMGDKVGKIIWFDRD